MPKQYQKKYNYVYIIENKVNGKIYIGVHKTNNLEDGYMGSGSALKRAYAKYGIENFEKTILKKFRTYQNALNYEHKLVNKEFINRQDTYNESIGGNHWEGDKEGLAEKLSRAQQLRFKDSTQKDKISKKQKEKWQDPVYQEKMKIALTSKTRTDKISKKVKNWIAENPEDHTARMEKINKNPDKIRKTAEKHRGMKRTEDGCKNISQGINEALKNPEVRLRRSGKGQKYAHNPDTKELKRFYPDEQIPEGWVWGAPRQSDATKKQRSESLKGSYFAYHKDTKEVKRFKKTEKITNDWIKGRPY